MKPVWASPVGCGRLTQDVLKKWTPGVPVTFFYPLPPVSEARTCQEKHTGVHTDTYEGALTLTLWHKPQRSPRTPSPVRSCTIIATVIHRCWILLASHKTWYAWFVQSARSVISFSFSFIFPFLGHTIHFPALWERRHPERLSGWLHAPRAMGGLKEPAWEPCQTWVKTSIWIRFWIFEVLQVCVIYPPRLFE